MALSRGVRAGTVLQDAMVKVRRARRRSEVEFELALGELFVLASDAFKQRNGFRNKLIETEARLKELEKENQELRYKVQTNGNKSTSP